MFTKHQRNKRKIQSKSRKQAKLGQEISATNSSNLCYESGPMEDPILNKEQTNINMGATSESIVIKDIEKTIRYPGDINISSLKISPKAEAALNVARTTILNQRRKIKTLQQAFNRHKQKVKCLKNLVEQLQKNNLISDNAAKILLVQMSHDTRSNKAKKNS